MAIVFAWLTHNTTEFSVLVFYTDEWLTTLTMAIRVRLRSMIPKVQFQNMQANYYYLDHFFWNFL